VLHSCHPSPLPPVPLAANLKTWFPDAELMLTSKNAFALANNFSYGHFDSKLQGILLQNMFTNYPPCAMLTTAPLWEDAGGGRGGRGSANSSRSRDDRKHGTHFDLVIDDTSLEQVRDTMGATWGGKVRYLHSHDCVLRMY
jgi:hypothetical protein